MIPGLIMLTLTFPVHVDYHIIFAIIVVVVTRTVQIIKMNGEKKVYVLTKKKKIIIQNFTAVIKILKVKVILNTIL